MSNTDINILAQDVVGLLKQLIATPSFSKEENDTAALIGDFFAKHQIPFSRVGNNVYAKNKHYDPSKQSILLNSHHDTVKPNKGYTQDPFEPIEKDGKIFGLGSNDAGGCLVSLIATFLYFYDQQELNHNLVFAASAEEEISGVNGIELVLPYLGQIDFGGGRTHKTGNGGGRARAHGHRLHGRRPLRSCRPQRGRKCAI
jgi:acetylornithine deacetylase